MTFILELVAGGVSGVVTKTATAPLERVKILLQLQGMSAKRKLGATSDVNMRVPSTALKYRGIWHTLITVLKEEGLRGWFKGNGANVVRVVPVYALKFAFNDSFKDMFNNKGEPLTFVQLMMSGTLAGLFQQCVTYPLETIRTRLTLGVLSHHKYHGIIDAFVTTLKHEGIRGLYKGLGPTILTGSPYVGLQMTFYEELNRNSPKFQDKFTNSIVKLFNGALAGIVAQTLTYPGDTVRRRMQTDGMLGEKKMYRNSWNCFMQIIRKEGIVTLFAGLNANIVRGIPGAAIQFATYDAMKVLFGV
jgi:hypothetical protein